MTVPDHCHDLAGSPRRVRLFGGPEIRGIAPGRDLADRPDLPDHGERPFPRVLSKPVGANFRRIPVRRRRPHKARSVHKLAGVPMHCLPPSSSTVLQQRLDLDRPRSPVHVFALAAGSPGQVGVSGNTTSTHRAVGPCAGAYVGVVDLARSSRFAGLQASMMTFLELVSKRGSQS